MKKQWGLKILLILFLAGIIIPRYSYGEIIFEDNFDNYDWTSTSTFGISATGKTNAPFGLITNFSKPGWVSYRHSKTANQVGDPVFAITSEEAHSGGKSLKYELENTYSDWNGGGLTLYLGGPDNSISGYKELYISVWTKFENNFVLPAIGYMMKLFRIYFGVNADLETANLSSARDRNNKYKLSTYIDYIGNNYMLLRETQWPSIRVPEGQPFEKVAQADSPTFTDYKQWKKIMYHIKLNTDGNKDGLLEFYIGDQIVAGIYNIELVNPSEGSIDNNKINTISVPDNYCEIAEGMPANSEVSLYIDDIVISTSYIGPDYVIGENKTGGSPVLHFSDIISGPKLGNTDGAGGLNENEHGAIVSIWGNNLGDSQGSSKVYIKDSLENSYEAAYVYYWKNADGKLPSGPADLFEYHKMQEIAFSIPVSAADGLGKIYVEVNGVKSNELDFTVRDGKIYFVKAQGDDIGGNGSWQYPWRTLSYIGKGAGNKINAGDVIYACDGINESGFRIGISDTVYFTGTTASPISLIAYPAASVKINGVVDGYFSIRNFYGKNDYWNFSKLSINTNEVAIHPFKGMRVVGMEITGPNAEGRAMSGAIGGSGDSAGGGKIFGNYIRDYGNINTSVFQHVFYLSNRDGTPNEAYEFGWNYLKDNLAYEAFHIYDQSACGDWSGIIKVHDNVVVNQRGTAFDISVCCSLSPVSVPVEVYNNLFINCGLGPHCVDGKITPVAVNIGGPTTLSNVRFYNNVIYGYSDNNVEGAANYAGIHITDFGVTVDFKNNIIVDTKNIPYMSGDEPDTYGSNIFFSTINPGLSVPSWAVNPITADPLFMDASNGDFRLQQGSPAIDAGSLDVSSIVLRDFWGRVRPQGNGYDIGAFEYAVTTSITGDINADGIVNVLDVQLCVNVVLGIETDADRVNKAKQVTAPEEECNVLDIQAVVNEILNSV